MRRMVWFVLRGEEDTMFIQHSDLKMPLRCVWSLTGAQTDAPLFATWIGATRRRFSARVNAAPNATEGDLWASFAMI